MADNIPPNDILIETYAKAKLRSDRIALDQTAWSRFCDSLPSQFRAADPEGIARRLITLRKGRKLPRLS